MQQTIDAAMAIVLAAFLWTGLLEIGWRLGPSPHYAYGALGVITTFILVAVVQMAVLIRKEDPDYNAIGVSCILQPIFTTGAMCLLVWACR